MKPTKNSYEPACAGKKALVVKNVSPDGIGAELGIEPGDTLLAVDGEPAHDELDYVYLAAGECFTLEIKKPDGEIWELEIEREEDEPLGLNFEETLGAKTCRNHCIFCFIDQMPPGMRETLYVKDDDERLSFLLGNYITLTNLREYELERICRWKIPVNISVHTTDPALRVKMTGNRCAGDVLEKLRRLAQAGVAMNCQIVSVPGYNNCKALERTLTDLAALYPAVQTVSVVPVGLTRYREGLAPLRLFTKEEAAREIGIIEDLQQTMLERHGTRFAYASDEFYLTAGRALPPAAAYEGFHQLENGVGMMADFSESFEKAFTRLKTAEPCRTPRVVVTGALAADFIREKIKAAEARLGELNITVVPVENRFFGSAITVAGLVTGQDILAALAGRTGQTVYLPDVMLKNDSELLLDDVSVSDLRKTLGDVRVVRADGAAFAEMVIYQLQDNKDSLKED